MPVSSMFLKQSADFLLNAYLPRIEQCVAALGDEDLWWRPNEKSNSIGNLILHLSGNVRQWIVSGIGGKPDIRVRQREFDERGGIPRNALLKTLRSTVEEAAGIIAALDQNAAGPQHPLQTQRQGVGNQFPTHEPDSKLSEMRNIQHKEVSVFYAVYHVVEHFSMHTGQIIQITKERTGEDLGFYGFDKGVPKERWGGKPD